MEYDDRLEVQLGFSNNEDIWLHDELTSSDAFSFDPSKHTPQHIVINEREKLPRYNYVGCRMTFRTLLSLARAGMRGEVADSITVMPPMIQMNTRDIFGRNCRRANYSKDISSILERLLALGNVHVMGTNSIHYGQHTIIAKTRMFEDDDQLIKAVKEEVEKGFQVFIYSYDRQEYDVPDHSNSIIFFRYGSIDKKNAKNEKTN